LNIFLKELFLYCKLEYNNNMAIKKVWVTDDCIACGVSESICPEVFKVHNKSAVKEEVNFSVYEEQIKEAAKNCPMQAIKYE